jgi:hypothetical protein
MLFFIEFLKTSGLFENWVQGLPSGLSESERSAEAGRAGQDSVIGAGRALALC